MHRLQLYPLKFAWTHENSNLTRKTGTFGRKLVEKEFIANKIISKTLKLYELLLYGKRYSYKTNITYP